MKPDRRTVVAPVTLLVGSILLTAGTVGCKTDTLAGPTRTHPEGPVTSLESPDGIEIPNVTVVDRTEYDLVEEMLLHRAMYGKYLRILATYYTEHGYDTKAAWARAELRDYQLIKPYFYVMDAAAPVATLRPTESITAADRLYEEGVALAKKAGHGVPVFYNEETMKLALAKFKQLVDEYSTSDKIDDAAFWIAEIHKEYFEEKDNRISLLWYQRAIDWNPNLPYPARFQMAVVYDIRMHEYEKALEMYQQVVEKERFNQSNVDFSVRRIAQLTTERTRHAPGEPVPELRPEPVSSPEPTGETTEAVEASPPPPARVP